MLWLEADELNSACYAHLSQLDGEMAEVLTRDSTLEQHALEDDAPVMPPPARSLYKVRWLALAASVLLSLGAVSSWMMLATVHRQGAGASVAVSTHLAQRRKLALGNGTLIDIGPESRLVLNVVTRRVRLDEGHARFIVQHDPAHPLVIEVGSATITDVGTVFDVTRSRQKSMVSVTQGSVRVDISGTPVELGTGQELELTDSTAIIHKFEPTSDVDRRDGIYNYRNATVGDVIADVARITGKKITASDRVQRMAFAGSIRIGANSSEDLARLMPALGLVAVKQGDGWELHAPAASDAR